MALPSYFRAAFISLILFSLWTIHPVLGQQQQGNLDLSWLEGTWLGNQNGRTSIEIWEHVGGHNYMGHAGLIYGKDTNYFEQLFIQQLGGYWVFISIAGEQQPILFTLIEGGTNQLVFDNQEHDFPQRIRYRLDQQGVLHARIAGKDKGVEKAVDFVFKRPVKSD